MDEKIKFVGQILDNVHGFIPYTAAEKKIIDTQLFKRLQSIKQLSVVNWVFPGSEHTRFIHSLGVMHIADKMAASLGLPDEERKILRLAGLLHDIGHYPLSHVCEAPYRSPMTLEELPDSEFCCYLNKNVREKINSFAIEPKTTLMSKSTGRHHEAIGALTVRSNEEIRKIIIDECGYDYAPDVIADIIIGKDRIFCVSQNSDAALNLTDTVVLASKAATKGGLVFIVFELVYILLLSIIFPISTSFNILVSGTFSFLSRNAYLYLLCFAFNSFLVGFVYTAFAFSISINNIYPLETFIIPQLYYVFRLYCPFEWMINLLPMDTYDIASKTRPLGEHVISLLIILPIIVLIFYLKLQMEKRSDTK